MNGPSAAFSRIVLLGPRFFELPSVIFLSLGANLLTDISGVGELSTMKGYYTLLFLLSGISSITLSWMSGNWWEGAREEYQEALAVVAIGQQIDSQKNRVRNLAVESTQFMWFAVLVTIYVVSTIMAFVLLIIKA